MSQPSFAVAFRVLIVSTLLTGVACAWGDQRAAITRHLNECKDLANKAAPDGIGTVTRAAEIGRCFTEDVTVDLGRGAAPIVGREMVIGMAARLQPRTSEYRLEFADINVQVASDEQSAAVNLTAELIRRESGSRQSMDAREFELTMRREDGEWRIARVAGVQTLK
jgi:hypothetical protein